MQLDLTAALRKQVSADSNFNCFIIRIIFKHFVIAALVSF
jgi:hypothetical protein